MTGARERHVLTALLAAAVAVAWGPQLSAGFWLDETATWFVVRDGFAGTWSRTRELQWQSVPFSFLACAASWLPLPRELALRMPAFVPAVIAVVLQARLGLRLLGDPAAALLSAIYLVVTLGPVAVDSRPYGLGLLGITGAGLALVRWSKEGRARDAVLAVLAAALIPFAQPLWAAAWLGLLALVVEKRARLVPLVLATLVLVAPLLAQVLGVAGERGALSYSEKPSLRNLALALFPPRFLAALAVAALLAARPTSPRAALVLGHAFPPLAFWAISHVTTTRPFVFRWYACALPMTALLLAESVRRSPARARIAAAVVLVAWATTRAPREDWRVTTDAVRALVPEPATPVLVRAGFIESNDPAWHANPKRHEWLLAPLVPYPIPGSPRVVPNDATPETIAHLASLVTDAPRVVLVAAESTSRAWLLERLASRGYVAGPPLRRDGVTIVQDFRRP